MFVERHLRWLAERLADPLPLVYRAPLARPGDFPRSPFLRFPSWGVACGLSPLAEFARVLGVLGPSFRIGPPSGRGNIYFGTDDRPLRTPLARLYFCSRCLHFGG